MSMLRRRPRHPARWLSLALVAGALVAPATISSPSQAHSGHDHGTVAAAAAEANSRVSLTAVTVPFKALVFSRTASFRHDSIGSGVTAIKQLGTDNGFTVTATEDPSVFTDSNLAQYQVVVFLSTTGDVLNSSQQSAFERYIKAGGGYAGVHSATDTEYDWSWYGSLVGAYFNNHPNGTPTATVKVTDPAHPSTAGLPQTWSRTDEWYNFRSDPSARVHVLAELDESTYSPGTGAMGYSHPIAWCQNYDGGRSWYTGLGHTAESFSDSRFLGHLLGGLQTAAGVVGADCTATQTGNFQKVTLDDNTSNPMDLAVAKDGRAFYIDRGGAVRVVQSGGGVVTAGTVSVYTGQEFGLLGIALDPAFASNNYLYLYYSPSGSQSVDRLSRFTMSGNSLVAGTEKVILQVPTQRQECCHAGGALEFDNNGNLYISTGDNTNPFGSDGYAPLDERSGRANWDSQRSAANTNSLSGKILRITPTADGSYTVPSGNLFTPGTAKTRSEIYAMGFRNPFRIGLDPKTNKLQVSDYGPDAGSANSNRGPDGRVEWNIVDRPGFYGWPYCIGANTPYRDYNFATSSSGSSFNCSAPVNDSPNNTGLTQLPAAIGTPFWQGKSSTGTPQIGYSGAPTAGGTYRFDANLNSTRKWPAYWDGKALWGDWNDSRLFSLMLNGDGTGVVDINRMLPGMAFNRPHAMQFGPDGALYMIEWGSGFGGDNTDSGVYRIDYLRGTGTGNRAPIAIATASPTSGPAPLTVQFDSTGSNDPDGTAVTLAWDFDGNGTTDSTAARPMHTYSSNGSFEARLTVRDATSSATASVTISVGNTPPAVKLIAPPSGGFIDFGDQVAYGVTVTDAEDGTVDCDRVVVQPALGHDEHSHPFEQYRGCSGAAVMSGDSGHVGAHVFPVLTATYTDGGVDGANPLTGRDVLVLQPKHYEGEYLTNTGRTSDGAGTDTAGVAAETTTDSGGGQNIGWITDGDWYSVEPGNLQGIDQVRFRVASAVSGGTIQIRVGSPTGALAGSVSVPGTGGWQSWQSVTATISQSQEVAMGSKLYFVTRRPQGSTSTSPLLNINWMEFVGNGVKYTPTTTTTTTTTSSTTTPTTTSTTPTTTTTTTTTPTTTTTTTSPTTTTTTSATTTTTTSAGNGCTASFDPAINSWGSGFVAQVKITSTTNISGWRVTVNLPSGVALTSSWNATASGSTGPVTFTPAAAWNAPVSPSSPKSFGFQANGSPTGISMSCTAT